MMLKKVVLSGVGLALVGLSRLAFNALALNGFSEELAGRLNVGLSLAILIALPVTTALGAPTVRFIAEARGRGADREANALIRLLLGLCLVATFLGAGTALGFAGQLADWRAIPVDLVQVAVGVAVGYALYQFVRNVLYAVDEVTAYTWIELAGRLAFFGSAGFAIWKASPIGLLAAFAVGHAVFVLIGLAVVRDRWWSRSGRAPTEGLAGFAFYGLLGSSASLGTRELAVLWAPEAVGLDAVAYLSLSLSLLTPLAFLPRMLRTVVFAESAEHAGRGDEHGLARALSEVSHWLLVANTPVCLLVVIVAGPLLTLVGGTPTVEHVRVFRLLAVAVSVEIVATPAVNALPGTGNIALPAWSGVAGLVAAIIVWAFTVPSWGATGLAAGLLASGVVKTAPPFVRAMTHLGLVPTRSPIAVAGVVLAGCLATLAEPSIGPLLAAGIFAVVSVTLLVKPIGELLRKRGNLRF